MPRRRISEEERRRRLTQGAELAALSQHPGWQTLLAVLEEERADLKRIVLAKTLGGREAIDNLYLLHARGFIHGMQYVAAVVAGAERTLERTLQEGIKQQEEVQ